MRLAILSDAVLPTPYSSGHGLGFVVHRIAEGLLAEYHDCVLFAKTGSMFSGSLVMPPDAAGYEGENALAREALKVHRDKPFDAFLDSGHLHILARLFPRLPCVNVFHDSFQEPRRNAVLMSEGQKAMLPPEFGAARVIPNSLDPASIPANYTPADQTYAFFLGALSDIKQPMLAIEACARMGLKLVIAGSPIIGSMPFTPNGNVEYVGPVAGARKWELMAGAHVFLQLGVAESFGLTTLEAMLCGTPVVAWPAGGSLDLVSYGQSGTFVPVTGGDKVHNVVSAIERAWYVRRDTTRMWAEQLCDSAAQIRAYEDACGAVMRGETW